MTACQASKHRRQQVECELRPVAGARRRSNQRSSATSSAATGSPATIRAVQKRFSVAFASGAVAVRVHPDAEEAHGFDRRARLLEQFAPEPVERVLVLLEVAARGVPEPTVRLDRPAVRAGSGPARPRRSHTHTGPIGVADEATAAHSTRAGAAERSSSVAHRGQNRQAWRIAISDATVPGVSPRHVPASVTELQRIGLFGSLPGETIAKLAERMVREEFPPGAAIVTEGEAH